jgi:hypothetical protein
MKKIFLVLTLLFSAIAASAQSKIVITTNFDDVKIFKMQGQDKIEPAIGVGSAEVKLSRKDINRFLFEKEGYKSEIKDFPRTQRWPKTFLVNLTTRIVEIAAEPFDAKIFLDGKYVTNKTTRILIPKGKVATIEIKKSGFEPIVKVYYNEEGKDIPPLKEDFILENRVVEVKVTPLDGNLSIDKNRKEMGSTKVIIPKGKCVLVEATKEGFVGQEKVFCNKDTESVPPTNYSFNLEDRLVNINSTPNDTEIIVDGKVVGLGNYSLKVPKNKCVEVNVKKEGFISAKKNYCNSNDYQEPPTRDHIELIEDEAYATSVSTDLANVKFTVDVREGISELDAWKVLSQIVTTEFDVLEVIDKETGYLRTAWQVQSFNGKSTIRTRIIVSLNDSNPLKYAVKISSERADGIVSAKEDEKFSEWNRILKKYKNIIEEAQTRL